MSTLYAPGTGSFVLDNFILPGFGGAAPSGVGSLAEVSSFSSGVINDINTFQSIGFRTIGVLSDSSYGLSAASVAIDTFGRYVPIVGYGLSATESAARAYDGDTAGAIISGAANSSGIYVTGLLLDGAEGTAILLGSSFFAGAAAPLLLSVTLAHGLLRTHPRFPAGTDRARAVYCLSTNLQSQSLDSRPP